MEQFNPKSGKFEIIKRVEDHNKALMNLKAANNEDDFKADSEQLTQLEVSLDEAGKGINFDGWGELICYVFIVIMFVGYGVYKWL